MIREITFRTIALLICSAALGSVAFADSLGFGTAVAFNGSPVLGNGHAPIFNDGVADSTSSLVNPGEGSIASATALATPSTFSVGISVISDNRSFSPAALAEAVTTYDVLGSPPGGVMPLSVDVSGNFILPNSSLSSAELIFSVGNLSGFVFNQLDVISQVPGNGRGPVGFTTTPACPGQPTCPTGLSGDWTGAITLNLLVPVTAAGNGIAIEMWGFASSGAGESVTNNFLDTATLTFLPPPGVVVKLADGQTFGAATVPEPSSLLLLSTGLLTIVGLGWKKFCA